MALTQVRGKNVIEIHIYAISLIDEMTHVAWTKFKMTFVCIFFLCACVYIKFNIVMPLSIF